MRGWCGLRGLRWLKLFVVCFTAWCGGMVMAYADSNPSNPVAYVKTTAGEAWIIVNGKATPATLGTAVPHGSVLKTGSGSSSLGITFTDNTVMSFGPDTEMVVDNYLYAPNQSQFGLSVNLLKGTLNYVSGLIAKLKPESVTVKTPTGIIGVRGTQFVVRVDND